MKKISTVLTGILLSSALFTACSKDDGNMAVNPNAAPSASAKGVDQALIFNTGGITASQVMIMSGERILYQTDMAGVIDLGSNAASLKVEAGVYKDLSIKVTTSNDFERMNLWLTGEIAREDGTRQAVEFVMFYPMKLSVGPKEFSVIDATTVMDLLNINGVELARDITMDMLMEADKEGDVIRITQKMNPHLYRMIVDRLSRMVDISYINTDPGPTKGPGPVPVAAADPAR